MHHQLMSARRRRPGSTATRIKATLAVGAGLVLTAPLAAIAGPPTDRATGGGQILAGQGAGSTIAFTAQGTPELAKGQVQVIDRSVGTGRDQVKFHGIVECMLVVGNTAEIAGVERQTGAPFTLRVVDNGEGANAEADLVFFDRTADDFRCESDDNDDDDGEVALARGNVQVYDAP